MEIQLNRYKPVILMLLAIGIAIGLCDVVLRATNGRWPLWYPETIGGLSEIETHAGQRTAAIVSRERQTGSRTYNLVLGQSQAVTDVDCSQLEKELGKGANWYCVSGENNSFAKMAYSLRTLRSAGLHPTFCLLIIDPVYLAGTPMKLTLPGRGIVWNRGDKWDPRYKNPSWVIANQRYVTTYLQTRMDDARNRWLNIFKVKYDARFDELIDPRSDLFDYKHRGSDAMIQGYINQSENFGEFEPSRYSAGSDQAHAFKDIVNMCRALGSKVIAVIPPTSPVMMQRVPSGAIQSLNQILSDMKVTVVDTRTVWPNDLMFDPFHLNHDGRTKYTHELATAIAQIVLNKAK